MWAGTTAACGDRLIMHAWDRGGELGGCNGSGDEHCSGGGGDIVDRKGGNED